MMKDDQIDFTLKLLLREEFQDSYQRLSIPPSRQDRIVAIVDFDYPMKNKNIKTDEIRF